MMKTVVGLLASVLLACSASSGAMEMLSARVMDAPRTYKIDVLQVTDIAPYQESLDGFLKTLRENGIVQGDNLVIRRVKIDFDVENGGFWDRMAVLRRIKDEAESIVMNKPDLVLTIGTPATKYARRILEVGRIPAVFTAVANPVDAGSTSLMDGGPGMTGSTLHIDMVDSMKMVKELFPSVTRIGMVHTDDENGTTHVEGARASGQQMGVTVTSRLVNKQDSIIPPLKELYNGGNGVQMFAVPLDTYYAMRKYEPTHDLSDFAVEYKVPVVAFALVPVPGAVLYVGADFGLVGNLAGTQAVKILKFNKKADVLPILRQENPTVLIDPNRAAALKLTLPASVLKRKSLRPDGFWEIAADGGQ
jgi:putative ABC transport system substrate-binding protein